MENKFFAAAIFLLPGIIMITTPSLVFVADIEFQIIMKKAVD